MHKFAQGVSDVKTRNLSRQSALTRYKYVGQQTFPVDFYFLHFAFELIINSIFYGEYLKKNLEIQSKYHYFLHSTVKFFWSKFFFFFNLQKNYVQINFHLEKILDDQTNFVQSRSTLS